MRKRLVRKAFDMILGITMSENKDVRISFLNSLTWHSYRDVIQLIVLLFQFTTAF